MLIETLVFTSLYMGARVEAPPVVTVPVPMVNAPAPVAQPVSQPATPPAPVQPRIESPVEEKPTEHPAKVSKKLHVEEPTQASRVDDGTGRLPKKAAQIDVLSAGMAQDAVGAGIMDSYTDNEGETVYLSMGKQS